MPIIVAFYKTIEVLLYIEYDYVSNSKQLSDV